MISSVEDFASIAARLKEIEEAKEAVRAKKAEETTTFTRTFVFSIPEVDCSL